MSIKTIDPSASPEWSALQNHYTVIKDTPVKVMFDQDQSRFDTFSYTLGNVLFDFSKHNANKTTKEHLVQLGQACGIQEHYGDMLSGKPINHTENRAVLHCALRTPLNKDLEIDGENINEFALKSRRQIQKISDDIRSNPQISDVVHIGAGGSNLGPQLVCEALKGLQSGPRIHFIANIDSQTIRDLFAKLNRRTTRFIIASKTFTTAETMAAAKMAVNWAGDMSAFYAVTAAPEKALEYGIPEKNILPLRGWIGGRFSTWSAIGLPVAVALGYEQFATLLEGANLADHHATSTPLEKNIPFMMAALGVWYRNFWDYRAHAILPYADSLSKLPAYMQQLDMESNGKAAPVKTGPVVFGGVGTNVQHAFMQFFHQGTDIIPCDFIVPVKNRHADPVMQKSLVANALAQSRALMNGKESAADEPHHSFSGNRPSTTILLPELNAKTLGILMAIYEHKIFMQGIIWNINSFDQWGVELGKQLARNIERALIEGNLSEKHDSSTENLIRAMLKME
jgi:glucose-6-phosphate isomerase